MKPIIFSAQEVRATLDGSKTQFRRIVKPQPFDRSWSSRDHSIGYMQGSVANSDEIDGLIAYSKSSGGEWTAKCPFGKVGDKIFVKETWVELLHTSPATDEPFLSEGDKLIEPATFWIDKQGNKRWRYDGKVIAYRATSEVEFCDGDGFCGEFADKDDIPRWKSPVTMPQWASRITLEITDIRVQRLQDISEKDAIAEVAMPKGECFGGQHKAWFADSWGKTWLENPFVWSVSYKRVN